MKTIHIHIWAQRLEKTPTTVFEALEELRKLLREDPIAKREFFQAAREGWRFERFSRQDQVALVLWAAIKEALEKTRQHLGVGVKNQESTLKVRLDPQHKAQPQVASFPWKGPDGQVYLAFPWDMLERIHPHLTFTHPQYGKGEVLEVKGQVVVARFRVGRKRLALRAVKQMVTDPYAARPDRRVAEAKGAVERFLASGEEIRSLSRIEREEELAGNPNFSEGLVSQETVERLAKAGVSVDPYNLQELASLVGSLPAREEKFKEAVLGIDTLRTRDGKCFASRKQPDLWETKAAPDASESFTVLIEAQGAHAALVEILQGEEGWSASEVRPHLSKLAKALQKADAKRLFGRLQEISALRQLKVELHRAGFAPVRAVAYRDSTGEVVYTAPTYG
jgi:hypothetical protein